MGLNFVETQLIASAAGVYGGLYPLREKFESDDRRERYANTPIRTTKFVANNIFSVGGGLRLFRPWLPVSFWRPWPQHSHRRRLSSALSSSLSDSITGRYFREGKILWRKTMTLDVNGAAGKGNGTVGGKLKTLLL